MKPKCEYRDECRTRAICNRLCYENMTEEEKTALGRVCPTKQAYTHLGDVITNAEQMHLIPNGDRQHSPFYRGYKI